MLSVNADVTMFKVDNMFVTFKICYVLSLIFTTHSVLEYLVVRCYLKTFMKVVRSAVSIYGSCTNAECLFCSFSMCYYQNISD